MNFDYLLHDMQSKWCLNICLVEWKAFKSYKLNKLLFDHSSTSKSYLRFKNLQLFSQANYVRFILWSEYAYKAQEKCTSSAIVTTHKIFYFFLVSPKKETEYQNLRLVQLSATRTISKNFHCISMCFHCASAIFHCATVAQSRKLSVQYNMISPGLSIVTSLFFTTPTERKSTDYQYIWSSFDSLWESFESLLMGLIVFERLLIVSWFDTQLTCPDPSNYL